MRKRVDLQRLSDESGLAPALEASSFERMDVRVAVRLRAWLLGPAPNVEATVKFEFFVTY